MTIELQSREAILTRLNMVIWGDTKVGKTTYAMSAPGRKLIINLDPDGFSSIMHREDFDVIDLSQYSGKECIENAKKAVAMIKDWSKDNPLGTVILDSMTTLTYQAVKAAVENGIGKSAKFSPTLEVPGLSGWGARNSYVNDICDRILRITNQTNLNCIFIAHTDDPEYDKDGKTIIQQTMMLGAKIRQMTGLRASEIWNITDGTKRRVFTAPHGVRKPMGSRMFDTAKVKDFDLNYDITKPDLEQECSIASLVKVWRNNGCKKLTVAPK